MGWRDGSNSTVTIAVAAAVAAVVSAIVVAVLYGSWPARVAAALDFAALVFIGQIFSGLSTLDVPAVGHTTAIAVSVLLGSLLAWQLRRRRPDRAGLASGA